MHRSALAALRAHAAEHNARLTRDDNEGWPPKRMRPDGSRF
jgi:hypothetical protein